MTVLSGAFGTRLSFLDRFFAEFRDSGTNFSQNWPKMAQNRTFMDKKWAKISFFLTENQKGAKWGKLT